MTPRDLSILLDLTARALIAAQDAAYQAAHGKPPPRCSDCGTDFDNQTAGCDRCIDRYRNRKRWREQNERMRTLNREAKQRKRKRQKLGAM